MKTRGVVGALLSIGVWVSSAVAACPGDCSGDGAVTVDELVLGVNIALGAATASQCGAMDTSGDGQLTVDEIIGAVNSALNGCPAGLFAGDYSASVSFDATHSGIVNVTAARGGQVSGGLLLGTNVNLHYAPALSFTYPVGAVSVAVSGSFDPTAGGFEVSGSFVDGSGATIDVVISGNLPGPTGSAAVNVYVGSDVFPAMLTAGMLGTPTPTPTVTPTPPPGNGARLVFSGGAIDPHIYVMNVDGSGKTAITSPAVGTDVQPAWSPDGTKIAFTTPYKTGNSIAVMNADGSQVHVLTTEDSPLDFNAAWSPDGTQIAFTAGSTDAIEVINVDGSGRHQLVHETAGEAYGHLSWSPDGSRIAVESTRPRQSGSEDRSEIWVVNADGSNFVRLTTNDVPDLHPDWSPSGAKIIFARKGAAAGIYTINPDGTGESRIIFDPFALGFPNWSHDGTQIAYTTLLGLKITNANGTNGVSVPNTSATFTDYDFR